MTTPSYTVTQDSIVLVLDGTTHTVKKGTANFLPLREALLKEDWAALPQFVTVARSIEHWAKGFFTVRGDQFHYKDQALPTDLNARIVAMATKNEDPTFLLKFWERLQLNPSHRSVQQLFPFLQHEGIAIDQDGFILAYKSVREDYKDHHSGTVVNKPGSKHEMERNRVSDDPNHACHFGFHVGALAYAEGFGSSPKRIMICRIDPADVVSIPFDAGCQKMRVCKYEVLGHYGITLPSTTFNTLEKVEVPLSEVKRHGADDEAYEEDDEAYEDDDDLTYEDEEEEKDEEEDEEPEGHEFDDLNGNELMKQPIELLRKYASGYLSIVGASKIPGGKEALVGRILEVR